MSRTSQRQAPRPTGSLDRGRQRPTDRRQQQVSRGDIGDLNDVDEAVSSSTEQCAT
jgi:hypothetical protein